MEQSSLLERHEINPEGAGLVVATVGATLAIVSAVYTFRDPASSSEMAVELLMGIGVSAILVFLGYKLATSSFAGKEAWEVTRWWLVGSFTFLSLTLLIFLHEIIVGNTIVNFPFILASAAAGGGVFGIVAGRYEVSRLRQENQLLEESRGGAFTPESATETASTEQTDFERPTQSAYEKAREQTVRRQRTILEYVEQSDGESVSTEELTDYILARSEYPTDRQATTLQLHHHDLPELADMDVIQYDAASKQITTYHPQNWQNGKR
ncbi:4TM region of histidine kinase [Haladaptatus litoreus]|uniref:4TM region of histidine kinase n=1 Tax=Haladaptatus litoreus TaxID=553468 RepID=A0A1N7E502_9EURY|nr:hypothetical protein [Haladaptatus litoreus]SIR83104.1 4TM region of histidine kinase [Haladaptatus litoreus]